MKQRTPEWLAARRSGITSTDIVAILGISPWRSEGDVARDKMGLTEDEPDAETARRFRIGLGLEAVIAAEEEVEHGVKLRRVHRLVVHPSIPWAMTSLDFERIGERTIVEAKSTTSRDWEAGLPEYVEVQVRWQMGVAGYPRAHVAALRFGSELACFDVEHDPAMFAGLLAIGADFRERLAAGGPFEESRASVRRAYPADDGETIVADDDTADAVAALLAVRRGERALEQQRETLETAIQMKMGPAATMTGPGWTITWKRAKDSAVVDWRGLAEDALTALRLAGVDPADQIKAYSSVRPGSRRFLIKEEGEG